MRSATLEQNEKARFSTIKNAETQIAQLKADMDKDAKVESEDKVKEELKRAKAEFNASSYQGDVYANEHKVRQLRDRHGRNKQAYNDATRQSRELNNLAQWDRGAADAARWLRSNEDKFRTEVFEPPVLSITVPNPACVRCGCRALLWACAA
ncbi:hypothetical protein C8R45DRAFT_1099377 [Mycena sanguinolenta]|nr:hypothetical protein C8R45DRAFT_1099377 [Mycena sanguinolenta]